jgi:ankyrin repeat protein
LYVAARGNQFAILQYLIEQGADINEKETDGWTILHRAVATNSLPIVHISLITTQILTPKLITLKIKKLLTI